MSADDGSRTSREQRLVEAALAHTGLLRGAAPAQLAALARQCATMRAKRGEMIVARGARPRGLYAVGEGTVKLSLRHGDGEERVLRLAQRGDTFGSATALLGRAARYEAHALTDCVLVVVPPAALFALIENDARAARRIVEILAERNLEMLGELEASTLLSGAQRLAAYLESLARRAPRAGPWTVRLPATKTVIASHLDMKKETFSRLLRALAEQGLIGVTQRDITLLDREKLAELAR